MAHFMQEVVVSGSSEDECLHLWDMSTATTLVSYRPAAPATDAAVAPIGRDFLAIAQAAKASLHVFQVSVCTAMRLDVAFARSSNLLDP